MNFWLLSSFLISLFLLHMSKARVLALIGVLLSLFEGGRGCMILAVTEDWKGGPFHLPWEPFLLLVYSSLAGKR